MELSTYLSGIQWYNIMQNNIFQWREVEIAVGGKKKMQGYRMKKEKEKKIALTF